MVAIARGALRNRRIGHTGTLDPFATGLLVLLIGQATRLARFVAGEPKVYDATIRFGVETDTDDSTGAPVREAEPPDTPRVEAAIAQLTGDILQVPSTYSAKQSGGVRAYDAARKGQPLDLPPAEITVHGWAEIARSENGLHARITCSGGTYVRALARDLGRLSGSAAHLVALRRLSSGPFSVDAAATIEQLRAGQVDVMDMRTALLGIPPQHLSADEDGRVSHGNPVPATVAGETASLVAPDGRLRAIAERRGEKWQPIVVLNA